MNYPTLVTVTGGQRISLCTGETRLDLARIEKKLREVGFFLNQMRDRESSAFADKEPFDFYLSAFLGAGIAFREAFHYKQDRSRNSAIKAWRNQWENSLSPTEKSLFDFMRKDRVADFHLSGSTRGVKTEEINIAGGGYTDKSGSGEVFGPPGMPPAYIIKPAYFFTITEVDRKATEACAEYLALLERMLADFKAAHPEPSWAGGRACVARGASDMK